MLISLPSPPLLPLLSPLVGDLQFCHVRDVSFNCVCRLNGVITFPSSSSDMALNEIVQQKVSLTKFAEFQVNPRIWRSAC